MAIKPVYRIPLTSDQLKAIGETAATLSIIEKLMQNTVSYLLVVPGKLAAQILGSTSTRTYSDLWLSIVEAKCTDRPSVALARRASKDFGKIIELWNSYHHSTYAVQSDTDIPGQRATIYASHDAPEPQGKPVAIKVKTNTVHDPAEITAMRDLAAALSHIVNQVCETSRQKVQTKP